MAKAPSLDTALTLTKNKETFGRFLESYLAARAQETSPKLESYMLNELLPFLENVTVMELGGAGVITYRLCGTDVVKRMGQELTGLNMLDFIPETYKAAVEKDVTVALTHPCGHYSRHHNLYSDGRTVEAETISLPVRSSADSKVNFLLSLHLVEDTGLSGPKQSEQVIGTDWLQAAFLDIGNGAPEETALNNLIT